MNDESLRNTAQLRDRVQAARDAGRPPPGHRHNVVRALEDAALRAAELGVHRPSCLAAKAMSAAFDCSRIRFVS